MDSVSFREAILADYILKVKTMTTAELMQELIDLKYCVLESLPDEELVKQIYVSRGTE